MLTIITACSDRNIVSENQKLRQQKTDMARRLSGSARGERFCRSLLPGNRQNEGIAPHSSTEWIESVPKPSNPWQKLDHVSRTRTVGDNWQASNSKLTRYNSIFHTYPDYRKGFIDRTVSNSTFTRCILEIAAAEQKSGWSPTRLTNGMDSWSHQCHPTFSPDRPLSPLGCSNIWVSSNIRS